MLMRLKLQAHSNLLHAAYLIVQLLPIMDLRLTLVSAHLVLFLKDQLTVLPISDLWRGK